MLYNIAWGKATKSRATIHEAKRVAEAFYSKREIFECDLDPKIHEDMQNTINTLKRGMSLRFKANGDVLKISTEQEG